MKKEKKKKIVREGVKKKWSLWMTIASVFGGVAFISGATVGGVYLAGGFDTSQIQPADISFDLSNTLYNSANGQFEVTEDFSMVVTSSTTNVSAKELTLSFDGKAENFNPTTRTISDGTIIVPRYVNINEPFTVSLNKTEITFEDKTVDWVSGGISKLVATSSNIHISSASVQIAVDVPVYNLSIALTDVNGNPINEVIENESFIASPVYFPAASQYLYSDNDRYSTVTQRRQRVSYFEAKGTQEVTFVYDEVQPHFDAGNLSSQNNIYGYTFIHAVDQINTINDLATLHQGEQLYGAILSRLASDENVGITGITKVDVVKATISSFNVTPSQNPFYLTSGERFNLSINPFDYADGFLGVEITSTTGQTLENMLRYVALKATYKNASGEFVDATNEILITGGQSVTINGQTYYFANTEVADLNFAFWDLYTQNVLEYRLSAVLLLPDENGYKIFDVGGVPAITDVSLIVRDNLEKPVTWASTDDVKITLNFDGETLIPSTYQLENRISIPQENVSRSVIFFASFKDSLSRPEDVIGSNYNKDRAGSYMLGSQEYLLYPLNGNEVSVIGPGEFKLFYATVKTDAHGYIYDETGKYRIVQVTADSINVRVTKTLHENSIKAPTIDLSETVEGVGPIFLEEGNTNKIVVSFPIADDSVGIFQEALEQNHILFNIYSNTDKDVTGYFACDYKIDENNNYVCTLSIASSLMLDGDLNLAKVSLTDTGTALKWDGAIAISGRTLNLYTPKFDATKVKFSENVNLGKTINVVQELTTGGDSNITITYYEGEIEKHISTGNDPITSLIQLLNLTIEDQHGKTGTLKNWYFATDNTDVIAISEEGQSFSFRTSDGANAQVYVCYRDVVGNTQNLQGQSINFHVSGTGITRIERDTSLVIGTQEYGENPNGNVTGFTVSKYGEKNQAITLSSLAKLYIGEGLFDKYTYSLNVQYLFDLSDEDIVALFGEGGMLTLKTGGIDDILAQTFIRLKEQNVTKVADVAKEIRAELSKDNVLIDTIKVNQNFATDKDVKLSLTNDNKIVNISVTVNLKQNIIFEGAGGVGDGETKIYAASNVPLDNFKVSYNSLQDGINAPKTLAEILASASGHYIIPNADSSVYYISESDLDLVNVGKIEVVNGKATLKFNDFWNMDKLIFTIIFYPENYVNKYASSATVKFTVTRNLKINENAVLTFDLASSMTMPGNLLTRVDGTELTLPAGFSYVFEDTKFTVNQNMAITAPTVLFDYNMKSIAKQFHIRYNNEDVGLVTCTATFNIKISETDIYQAIAQQLTLKNDSQTVSAKIESVGGVEYLFVLTNGHYEVNESLSNAYILTMLRLINDTNVTDKYLTATSDYSLPKSSGVVNAAFNNSKLPLKGKDDPSTYAIFSIKPSDNSDVTAYIVMPLLISNIGNDFGQYISDNTATPVSLELLSTTPDKLIESKQYQEVFAGGKETIVKPASIVWNSSAVPASAATDYGLRYLKDIKLTTSLTVFPGGNYPDIVKAITATIDGEWIIEFNQLSDTIQDCYVGLQFTLSWIGGEQQTYYYALKVVPTIKVEKPLYAYDGNVEYLTATLNKVDINLDAPFGDNTLHSGNKRFNISAVSGATVDISKITYTDKVVSVTLQGGQIMTDEKEFSRYVEFTFDESHNMKIVTKTSEEITFVVERTYLEVVEGKAYYNFVINSSENYKLEYSRPENAIGSIEKVDGNNASWVIPSNDNGFKTAGNTSVTAEEIGVADGSIYYLKNSDAKEAKVYLVKKATKLYTQDDTGAYNEAQNAPANLVLGVVAEVTPAEGYKKVQFRGNEYFIPAADVQEVDGYVFVGSTTAFYSDTAGTVAGTLSFNHYIVSPIALKVTLYKMDGATGIIASGLKMSVRGENSTAKYVYYDETNRQLVVLLNEFLAQDSAFECDFYNAFGFLGTLTVEVGSSAKVTLNSYEDKSAGKTYGLSTFIKEITYKGKSTATTANPAEGSGSSSELSYSLTGINVKTVTDVVNGGWENATPDEQNAIIENLKKLIEGNSADNSIKVLASVADFKAEVKVTLSLSETSAQETPVAPANAVAESGKEISFTLPLNIKANIKRTDNSGHVGLTEQTAERVNGGSVVAGNNIEQSVDKLISQTADSGMPARISFSWSGGNGYIEESGAEMPSINIGTKEVGKDGVEVTILIKISMYASSIEVNPNALAYQSFYVKYVVKITPNVSITISYPKPNNDSNLSAEYLESGASFGAAGENFFNGKAVFGEERRVSITPTELLVAATDLSYTVTLVEMSNADVATAGKHYSTIDGENAISLSENLVFTRGTWNGSANQDSGQDSYVIFRITSNGVSENYKVFIEPSVFNLSVNVATANSMVSSENTTAERYYVDSMGESTIFAKDRLLKMEMKSDIAAVTGNYTLRFTNAADAANIVEVTIKFSIEDAGKIIYHDLGTSLDGYAFTGAFKDAKDYQNYLFLESPKLSNRFNLTYMGETMEYGKFAPNVNLSSNYQTPAGTTGATLNLQEYTIEPSNTELNKEVKLNNFTLTLNNGQTSTTRAFVLDYIYLLDLDVDVASKVDFDKNGGVSNIAINEIEVQNEKQMNSTVGVKRLSTKEILSEANIGGNSSLSMSLIDVTDTTTDTAEGKILEKLQLNLGISNLTMPLATINGNEYLRISPKLIVETNATPTNKAYDYNLLGLGASNLGNYILSRLTFTTTIGETKYTKTFYIVFKIVPAYTILINGNDAKTDEGNNIFSNQTQPYELPFAEGNEYYSAFNISNDTGVVKVFHNYGQTKDTNVAEKFEYTMKLDEDYGGTQYNDKLNVNKKLKKDVTGDTTTKTTISYNTLDGTVAEATEAEIKVSVISSINIVQFGNQYYRVKVTDPYGYTFYFYFQLNGKGMTPSVKESLIEITEGQKFAIATDFKQLSVTEGNTVGDKKSLIITPETQTVTAVDTVLATITGMNFYFYKENYIYSTVDGADNSKGYFDINNNGILSASKAGGETERFTVSDSGIQYLTPSDYDKIKVAGVDFRINGESVIDNTTLANPALQLGNGSAYWGIDSKGATISGKTLKLKEGTDIFGGNNFADVTMVIQLSYTASSSNTSTASSSNDSADEYYSVSVPAKIYRNVLIDSTANNVVRDGEGFNPYNMVTYSEQYNADGTPSTLTTSREPWDIVDDTLRIILPAHQSASFNIKAKRTDSPAEEPNKVYYSIGSAEGTIFSEINTTGSLKTYYRSISELLGVTVKASDAITITPKSYNQSAEFYIKLDGDTESSNFYGFALSYFDGGHTVAKTFKTFTCGGSQDKFGVNHHESFTPNAIRKSYDSMQFNIQHYYGSKDGGALEIINVTSQNDFGSGNYYEMYKYYVIQPENGVEKYYRYRQRYTVTRQYSSIKIPSEINYVSHEFGARVQVINSNTTIGIDAWGSSFELYKLEKDNNGVISSVSANNATLASKDINIQSLSFEINKDASDPGSGLATINLQDGVLTLLSGFDITQHYVNIVVKIHVSGVCGMWEDRSQGVEFARIKLAFRNSSSV